MRAQRLPPPRQRLHHRIDHAVRSRQATHPAAQTGLVTPRALTVYVHAKVCVIDDRWASVGSDNFNRRSWTHDSELSAAVLDTTPAGNGADNYARDLRVALGREHLDDVGECTDPRAMFDAFAHSATALQHWHDGGRVGPRPPGRLRPLADPPMSLTT